MDFDKRLQASKVIAAPPEKIFELLADPNRHTEMDGAGMLRGIEGEAPPIKAIGQVFTMNMNQPAYGDYRMVNTVTAFVENSRIGWGPRVDPSCALGEKLGDMDAGGHTFTYDLSEVEGGTEVTNTYEWMSVKDPDFEALCPVVSEKDLAGSLDNIEKAVTK